MGSLMAGWDSKVKDPKAVSMSRNKSLTKEEIDAYWKTKKGTEEEHLRAITGDLNENQENIHKGSAKGVQRSSSLPLTDRRESLLLNSDSKKDDEKLKMTNCWWTRSNWAFLNEPPVIEMEGPRYKYASQYHVAKFGNSKTMNNSEIST